MLAALHTIAALGGAPTGYDAVSQLLAPYNRYVDSGEINSEVADQRRLPPSGSVRPSRTSPA